MKYTRTYGMLGPLVIALGTLISLWGYHLGGGDSHPFYYWPVSGLGDHNVAPWHGIFNLCVIAGALLMGLFQLGVGLRAQHVVVWPSVLLGMLAAVGLAGIGVFTSAPETLNIHFVFAGFAFGGALLSGILFLMHLLLHAPVHFPRWLVFPSALSILATAGLITLLALFVRGHHVQVLQLSVGGITISGIILMEWLAFISLNAWIFLTAWAMQPHSATGEPVG